MSLGKWAVIDIETTGINPADDDIIDLGYWQFDGVTLVKRFSSLVRSAQPISPFISKLTGISDAQVRRAPPWDQVEPDLLELEGHVLIAHNAEFERKFLERYFDRVAKHSPQRESFQDSLLYLGLLFPGQGQLNLEGFIQRFGFAEKEEHRGEADSRDLLKVLVAATAMTWQDREWRLKLLESFQGLPDDFWFKTFLSQPWDELVALAEATEVDLERALATWKENGKAPIPQSESADAEGLPRKFTGEAVKNFLLDEPGRQKHAPGYRARQAQVDMAFRVGQAFKNRIHALIQAPTGTGKTLGYLLPSALFALETREQVLVATGTKTLQDQVMDKDVPQLRRLLQLPESEFKVTRLVGSNNHLCELRFRDDDDAGNLLAMAVMDEAFSRAYFDLLFFHNSRAAYPDMITREQVPFILKKLMPAVRERDEALAVDYRACVGSQCPFVLQCSYVRGLREAKEAQLIVGNHAMLLSWPRSFPRPGHVVVDEAHKIEGEATRAFAVEITDRSVEALLKSQPQGIGALQYLLNTEAHPPREEELARLRDEGQFSQRLARDHQVPLEQAVDSLFKKSDRYHPVHVNELPFPERERARDELAVAILNHFESLCQIWRDLHALLAPYYERWEKRDLGDDKNKMKAWAVFESFWGQLEKHSLALQHYLSAPQGWVTALKYAEEEGWTVESAPIDVGASLAKGLLEPSQAVVYTSATLANATGDAGVQGVEWMTGYTYLPQDKRFKSGLYLPPTFDYTHKAKVFLCTDTRPISDPMFVPDFLAPIIPVVEEIGGRTLFLFSARARFETAVDILLKKFEGRLPVFVQGMGKNVVEEFKKSSGGILVGMESFGEGIDVPGDKLQLIVIDKIPDVRQEMVINKRREWYDAAFGNEFADYFLAQRARALHQKCGRLLRSETDYGAVIVADQRTKKWKGGTLRQFAKLMEPYKMEVADLPKAAEEVRQFLAGQA